ncbi:hypothetical protein V2U94_04120 [Paenibacillus polymyxa]|uniref:hypothetical protein n=1 Tax=Paenibacillus polymyxa TaxID=1406 RepID=UPI002ED4CAE6|nr:hypothetical protein [Paenibacillus polymyxa]
MGNNLANNILDAYKKQAAMAFLTLLLVILGIVTMVKFQSLNLLSFSDLLDKLSTQGNTVMLTALFNIVTGLGMIIVGGVWIFFIFKDLGGYSYYSYYEEETIIHKVVYALTGLIMIAFSCVFISYLLTKIGVLLVVFALAAILVWSWSSNK